MLRSRHIGLALLISFLTILSSACGQAVLQCEGQVDDKQYDASSAAKFGHVTCVTQQLDKEVTHGGQ